MDETPELPRSPWRRFTALYAALLSWLLVATIAVLVFPVSLQIFSRYTELIPSYIWTEELARFVFIWAIMLGAMLGIKDGTHFVVDVWPRLSLRAAALLDLAGHGATSRLRRMRTSRSIRSPPNAIQVAPASGHAT